MMDQNEARDDFYRQYGEAVATWGSVENAFAFWFTQLTTMRPNTARDLFFTPRGFSGSADLFETAISSGQATDNVRTLLRALIKKGRLYASIRNRIVHGIVVHDLRASSSTSGQYVISKTET